MKQLLIIALSLGVLLLAACSTPPANEPASLVVSDSVVADTPAAVSNNTVMPAAMARQVYWKLLPLTDSLAGVYLQGPHAQTLLALNRVDARFLSRQDSVLVPDTLCDSLLLYTPFPLEVEDLIPVKKILLFSYPLQAFAAYGNGQLLRWGPVSMGKQSTPTPPGLMHTNWKALSKVSTDNPEWLLKWYFNIVNNTGSSLHQYELPGYPASHSCIRLREEDAIWIYRWADSWKLSPDERVTLLQGTPVVVFGTYPFGAAAPWRTVNDDGSVNTLLADTVKQVVIPFLQTILLEQAQRDSLNAPGPLR